MTTQNICKLGYIGIEVSDLPHWERYSTELLGLESNGPDANGTIFLRMDENHHRIALHAGSRDDLAYAGWEVPDEASLQVVAAQLEKYGVPVTLGTAAEAQARRVLGLIKLEDPNGIPFEVYYGPLIEFERPFRSGRSIGGFETGDLGLGHIVLVVDDYEASLRFYRDGLGMRISDFIELEMGEAGSTTAAFFHCGPRHHSVAIVQIPAQKRLHHFMLQLRNIDDVGSTYDLCREQGIPITSTLGRHTNDHMLSFYTETPSGFAVEYGYGGRVIDDEHWEVQLHRSPSIWGHKSPETSEPADN